jgi:hypothetical protein
MSFFKAYLHKEYPATKNGHPYWIAAQVDVLRGYTTIPGRLLSSIACFRFVVNVPNLTPEMYIYKLS